MIRSIYMSIILSAASLAHAQVIQWTGLGNGLSWNDANNWSSLTLPDTSDAVIIHHAAVLLVGSDAYISSLQMDSCTLAVLSKLSIDNNDTFAISAVNSTLRILGEIETIQNGSSADDEDAVDLDSSILINSGYLTITQSAGDALSVQPGSVLNNLGVLKITDPTACGIWNRGSIENGGVMSVFGSGSFGLSNSHEVLNKPGALIDVGGIKGPLFHGINNHWIFTNEGFIHCQNIEAGALNNLGLFTNKDTISVDSVGRGIINRQTFINDTMGWIHINHAVDNALINGYNYLDPARLVNDGFVKLRHVGAEAFMNHGEAIIGESGQIIGEMLLGDFMGSHSLSRLTVEGLLQLE